MNHPKDYVGTPPFGEDVCGTWMELPATLPFYKDSLQQLSTGANDHRVIMLGAPRAGYGKTHLLGQWVAQCKGEKLFIGLPWEDGDHLQWLATAIGLVRHLLLPTQASESLREVAAGILASLLARSIRQGKVPCGNPQMAVRLIMQSPVSLFAEEGEIQAIGQWFRRNFSQLVVVLALETGLEPKAKMEIWLKRLFEYALQPTTDNSDRLVALLLEDQPKQLMTFLKLITLYKPVVLIADHMDALFGRQLAGVTVASFSVALASLPRVDVVLSMNRDLWDVTFEDQLPSALKDRLDSNPVFLEDLTVHEALSLVLQRLQNSGVESREAQAFANALQLPSSVDLHPGQGLSARFVLRFAAHCWASWLKEGVISPSLRSQGFFAAQEESSLLSSTKEERKAAPCRSFAPVMEPLGVDDERAEASEGFLLDPEDEETPQVHEASINFASPSWPNSPEKNLDPKGASHSQQLQELRDRLSKLNRHTPSEASHFAGVAGKTFVPSTQSSLEQVFQRALASMTGSFSPDSSWWGSMLKLLLPSTGGVNFHQIASPSLPNSALFSWISEDHEYYFGYEPASQRTYWKFVATYLMGRKVELDRKTSILNPKLGKAKLRLIKLATAEDPSSHQDCLKEMGMMGETAQRVLSSFHTVELGEVDLKLLRVLVQMENGSLPLSEVSDRKAWEEFVDAQVRHLKNQILGITQSPT